MIRLPAVVAWVVSASLSAAAAAADTPAASATDSQAQAVHLLNRLAYGPSPGDLRHVERIGIDAYIDEQLHPERLALPATLRDRLAALPTLQLSSAELVAQYRAAAAKARRDGEAGRAERRELFRQMNLEAGEARLRSAVESPRQLQEVMVDFWFNHFNVYSGKGMDRVLVANYEREAIRPYALGRFRDLLGATARHPAMLFYLDNWLSAAPGLPPGRGQGAKARASGLNENYARELMELHTLGVDGGYSQRDVTELARIFTGWTMQPAAASSGSIFRFDERRHDQGEKNWLGHRVMPGGRAEGEWALDMLAANPATARHIGFELAQFFVADEPPSALVDRLAQRFTDSDGDIAAVLRTLFDSPEFRAPQARTAKFKTPWQFLVSSLRAADLPIDNVRPLLGTLAGLGMPLYRCPTPDGYGNTEQAWLNPDAMTRRISFAIALAAGRLPLARAADSAPDGDAARPMPAAARGRPADASIEQGWSTTPLDADRLLATLGKTISVRTRATIAQAEPALRAAMVLGSPDFMRR